MSFVQEEGDFTGTSFNFGALVHVLENLNFGAVFKTEFTFENVNGKVKVKIKETGWDGDESGAKSAFANCSGWTEFLNALKVYTEYNISYLNK